MKSVLCSALLLSWFAVAQEIHVQLSPQEKENLRAARLGYPQPPQLPTNAINRYRTAAALMAAPLRTQTLALVTVTIVFSNETVMVTQTNGEMRPYLSAKQPLVISVVTNHFDVFRAKEVTP